MAKPLPLREAYDRRVWSFREQFVRASAAPATEAIHELRVALKQLRTFFNLAGALDPAFRVEESFAAARKIFREAGRVRNLHVLEAKAYGSTKAGGLEISEYYNWLKETERPAVRGFRQASKTFRVGFFDKAWAKIGAVLVEGPARGRVRQGLEARLVALIREMRRAGTGRRDIRRLHALRILAKEARYTLEILGECGLTGEDGARLNERLRDVHQALGRWHDEAVVLESLREFRSVHKPSPLISPGSYLAFARLARVHQAEDLASFEAAWASLLAYLGRGTGRKVFRSSSPAPHPDAGPDVPPTVDA